MTHNQDWLFSVDDHVLEPPDLWQTRLPKKFLDDAPQIVVGDDGQDYWQYSGKRTRISVLASAVGRTKEKLSAGANRYGEMRPGCYDSRARLEDMDQAGILASVCFPSFPRFCGQTFYEADDRELGMLCVQAYNDWMIDEWCGSAPGRFVPLVIIPLWDPKAAVVEMERCASRGARAVAFSENPSFLGLPSIHDPNEYWRPVFQAANDTEMVVCTHIGSSSRLPVTSDDAPAFVTMTLLGQVSPASALVDWLFSGWFQEFPQLKLALSEGGIGWIPYVLEQATYVHDRHLAWAAQNAKAWNARVHAQAVEGQEQPVGRNIDYASINVRELFKDHVYGCFIDDMHGVNSLDVIGVDNVMIETDYPHSDSTWPDCIEHARKQLAGVNPEDAYKVLRGNAERLFRFTPVEPSDGPVSTGIAGSA